GCGPAPGSPRQIQPERGAGKGDAREGRNPRARTQAATATSRLSLWAGRPANPAGEEGGQERARVPLQKIAERPVRLGGVEAAAPTRDGLAPHDIGEGKPCLEGPACPGARALADTRPDQVLDQGVDQ